jgi:hypothetical protein
MTLKNKTKRLSFLISIIFFITTNSYGQKWISSSDSRSFHLHNLFFHYLKAFVNGTDSNYYVLTEHRPDAYWEKKNEHKSELLISKVDKKGEIIFLKKLNEYVNNLVLKTFNNKYYLFDTDIKVSKKQYYHICYVYTSNWELESQLKIIEIPNQGGLSDFIVNREGYLFLSTKPHFNDYKHVDFKGSYIVKCSPDGEQQKKVFFDKSYASKLVISNDSILLQLHHQRLVYPIYQTDSIFEVRIDNDLNYTITRKKQFIPKEKKIDKEILLSDGEKIIYIDSTYFLSQNSWTSTFKIALLDRQNARKWTIEPNNRWLFGTPKALQNGTFITQIDKRWDSTCLAIFDRSGNQRSIKSFLMNADTRIDRYSFINFFEIKENEIWIFYKKESPTREEEIYFERLLL